MGDSRPRLPSRCSAPSTAGCFKEPPCIIPRHMRSHTAISRAKSTKKCLPQGKKRKGKKKLPQRPARPPAPHRSAFRHRIRNDDKTFDGNGGGMWIYSRFPPRFPPSYLPSPHSVDPKISRGFFLAYFRYGEIVMEEAWTQAEDTAA